MIIKKKFFPSILKDNEAAYFAHLEGIISSVDEYCSVQITRNPTKYKFRIATSLPKYNNMLIEELFKFHNLFNIKLDISKSIKSSGTIAFDIPIIENAPINQTDIGQPIEQLG